jgi:hypothetical protein
LGGVVSCCFNFCFRCCEGLGSDLSVGAKQALDDDRESAFKKASLIFNEVSETVVIQCGVDLLDDGAFYEVARLELHEFVGVELPGGSDLGCCHGC